MVIVNNIVHMHMNNKSFYISLGFAVTYCTTMKLPVLKAGDVYCWK